MGRRNRKRKSPEQRRVELQRRVRHWLLGPLRLLLLSALGVGLGLGAYQVAVFLRTSAYLSVRRIEVNGTSHTSMEELLQATGLRSGANIFSVDLDLARRRLQGHPWVKRASVKRVVPDRIVVEIEEQRPAALVSLEGLYLVNPEGEVFKRLQPGEAIDLPIITGIERSRFSEDPARTLRRIRAALAMIDRVERTACLHEHIIALAEIHTDDLLGTTLVLDPGALSVRLGRDAPEARLPVLCRLLDELQRRDIAAHTVLLDHAVRLDWATVRLTGGGRVLDGDMTEQYERI